MRLERLLMCHIVNQGERRIAIGRKKMRMMMTMMMMMMMMTTIDH
jgi:hypothetical protein